MVKFSIMTALDPNAPVTDVVDVAKATEEAGFDTLWL